MTSEDRITTIDDCILFFDAPGSRTDSPEFLFLIGLGRQLAAEVRRLRGVVEEERLIRAEALGGYAQLERDLAALRQRTCKTCRHHGVSKLHDHEICRRMPLTFESGVTLTYLACDAVGNLCGMWAAPTRDIPTGARRNPRGAEGPEGGGA